MTTIEPTPTRLGYNSPGNASQHIHGLTADVDDFERGLVLLIKALDPVLATQPSVELPPPPDQAQDSDLANEVASVRYRVDTLGMLVQDAINRLRV